MTARSPLFAASVLVSAAFVALTLVAAPVAAGALPAPSASAGSASPSVAPAANTPAPVPCALGDITPISVPSPSPLPTHDAKLPPIGGAGLAGNGLSVPAGSPALPANLAATSWVVADLDSGEILGACGAHRYGAPASLQKLLLVETVLPKLNKSDVTTITPEDLDFEPGSSAVGLILGGQYSVDTLFLGLMLNSGNDAANTLARLGSGGRGVPGALADMNAEAHRLGAWDSHAETPSGLDGPGQVTSAYDLALIFRADFAHEDFRRYVSTKTAMMPPQPPMNGYQIQNDNRLLFEYDGALGGKTGFTDIARHTYVGAAERNGRRLVVTVLGAEIRPVRAWQQGAGLLDWGFSLDRAAPSMGRLVAPGEADKLLEPPPAPPAPVEIDGVPVLPASGTGKGLVLLAVGAGAAAVILAWLLAMQLARRRRTPHRRWRSDPGDTPVEALAPDPTGSPGSAAGAPAGPAVATLTRTDPPLPDGVAEVTTGTVAAEAEPSTVAMPTSPAPAPPPVAGTAPPMNDETTEFPKVPPLMGQPPTIND